MLLQGLAGDDAAHRAFLTEAAGLLRAFFRNRLRGAPEDAEDLVQETLVALHTRRDSYDSNYPLTAWMYAIARYRLIDFLRRAKHRVTAPIDGLEIGDADPEYEASDAPFS
ncbi:MAG: RNA polymerase subunit sigma, partial [Alphaproteobacteria bacterium]